MAQGFGLIESCRKSLEKALGMYSEAAETSVKEEDELIRRLSNVFQEDGGIRKQSDYLEIIGWKWPPAKGKPQEKMGKVTRTSSVAFALASKGEVQKAIEGLDDLRGVAPRMASAILMFYDPTRFTVMDVNAWLALMHCGAADPFDFGWEEASDYRIYLQTCRAVQEWFRHSLRDTDRALWTLGAKRGHLD